MDAYKILMLATIRERKKSEVRIVLKNGYKKEFVCKIDSIFEDEQVRKDMIIKFQRSENTLGFPSEDIFFEAPVDEIKKLSDY